MDKKAFFDHIRPKVNLTTANVSGLDKVLDFAELRRTPTNDLAYILATAWWETAQTMQPVKEAYWLSEAWRKANLRYYPWYGRGLIQTTWEANYRKIAVAMGLPEKTFIENPDLLLTMAYALPAMFVGMEKGIYTGKKLDDYIDDVDESDDEDLREYANARRIVNGTDRAATIAKLALMFEYALKAAGYSINRPTVLPPSVKPPVPAPEPEGRFAKIWKWIISWIR